MSLCQGDDHVEWVLGVCVESELPEHLVLDLIPEVLRLWVRVIYGVP